jgi:nucleotide-binding universal stress UspA family protein
MNRVLVPVDGSQCSLAAIRYLVDGHGQGRRPEIHLVNVQVPMNRDVGQFISGDDLAAFHREKSDAALAQARAGLESAGIPFEAHAAVGSPGDTIAQLAERLACDHIVMGTHGRAALAELLVGSTTVKVLHHARVPVVLVK